MSSRSDDRLVIVVPEKLSLPPISIPPDVKVSQEYRVKGAGAAYLSLKAFLDELFLLFGLFRLLRGFSSEVQV